MKKQTILVTGGLGYIGSHTVVELVESGYEVIIIDNLSNSKIDVLNRIKKITSSSVKFYQLDLCDKKTIDIVLSENKHIDGIIHFAALKAVGESVNMPQKYYINNLMSMLNLMDGMNTYNIQNFVFSSSCTVYGQPKVLPVTEKSPFQYALSPYGRTKQINEYILQDNAIAYPNLNLIALRYFNPVGAHKSALIGEFPVGTPSNLVPYITQTAAGILECLQVYGNNYSTKDGTAIRDYIHVVDLAKAHILAIERLIKEQNETNYEFFNIGTGKGYTVKEIIDTFEKVNGVNVKHKIAPRRQGDIEKIYADTQKAKDVLGWQAELGLEEMLKDAWEWQKQLK